MRTNSLCCSGCVVAASVAVGSAMAQVMPGDITIDLEPVADGLSSPVTATHAGDGSGRLFVVDQIGVVRIVDADGTLLPAPFLDLTAAIPELNAIFDERGLLGLAFHPDYADNGRFFVRYSAPREGNATEPCFDTSRGCHYEVLAEFRVSGDPNVAVPNGRVLHRTRQPQFNHDAGHVAFGPDGLLYFGLGDGGGANDSLDDPSLPHGPLGHGQNIDTPLGAVLRIDVDAEGDDDDSGSSGSSGACPSESSESSGSSGSSGSSDSSWSMSDAHSSRSGSSGSGSSGGSSGSSGSSGSGSSGARPVVFTASASGDQEVPPNDTDAGGFITLQLSADRTELSYHIQLDGLDLDGLQSPEPADDVVAMHLHGAPAGANGPVLFGIISPDQDPDDRVIDALAGTVSGTWDESDPSSASLCESLSALLAGDVYLNVHTVGTPSGEIRGQIGLAYAIPADNPFVGAPGVDEIYAYGLRNPYRFSFDDGPGGSGQLLLSDVGQNLFEEVNVIARGGNYGWVTREGFHCFDPFDPTNPPADCPDVGPNGEPLLDPIAEYDHGEGTAIVGGFVYRGDAVPALTGTYLFGDFSVDFGPTGRLFYLDLDDDPSAVLELSLASGSGLGLLLLGYGEDEDGELYVLGSETLGPFGGNGKVLRIVEPVDAAADLDGSGQVDFTDLMMLVSAWGSCAACPADLDGSGAVDFGDLTALISSWG